ncbi:MAG: S9 family peptidase, partial [Planctomycetota bacterium]
MIGTMRNGVLIMFVLGMSLNVDGEEAVVKPPVAKIVPKTLTMHGDDRIDNYYWLNQREDQEVLDYLNDENAYTKSVMSDYKRLEEKLFVEIKARIKQDDSSVPYTDRGYVYYVRFEEGKQYPVYCRKQGDESAAEGIMLDVNELAKGHDFCRASGATVSSSNDILAFATDFQGRRIYTGRFKNLTTGEMLDDEIPGVTGNMVWAEDSKTLFYTRQDPQTLRWFQVWKHRVGTPASEDKLIFEEKDEEFSCYLSKSRSRKYILIQSEQTLSSEWRFLDASQPDGEFKVFAAREPDHEYSINHYGDHFYVLTNKDARNFRLMKATQDAHSVNDWQEVIGHNPDELLQRFVLFRDYLVVQKRRDGLSRIKIIPWKNGSGDVNAGHELDFGEPAYAANAAATPDPETETLRFAYESMTTPDSVFDYNMRTREKTLLKEDEVLGGFDKKNYRTERHWATARDGVKVPVSIVYHKDTPRNGTAPCLQYAYGSYGSSMNAGFSSTRLNLLDRGFVYAIAHIRGGQEMGRHWYEDGKLLKKMNTFTDFVDCGKFLIENNFSDPKRLYARGGSAGGLLMGAVMNIAPDLYHGVVADVPFVDVVTTMLDDTIPLTTSEYDEWGNPNEKVYYDYMLSYSPYDQVEKKAYPNVLVTTGLHDSQVQYWEPAKWVAKLRAYKTDNNILLLKTNMSAGHGGASGRFDRFKEVAFRHA